MRLDRIIPRVKALQQNLRSSTVRGFGGGWNVLDDDMNLSQKYSTVADNIYADNAGVMRVRQGTALFAACGSRFTDVGVGVVDMFYFAASIVVVGTNGEVLRITSDGTVSRIWDNAIAATLPDAPSGWGPTDFVSFEVFNGHLIVCNGIDKPLDIDASFHIEYLQDAATGTNINVPVCKYVKAVGRYLCMAGDPLEPDRVHISAKDAAGTWFGDPPPNDATRIDVGSVLPGATIIRGLLELRGKLVVMFAEGLVFGTLGATDSNGNHTPNFDDSIKGYGSISHRAGIAQGDDALFMDLEGVPSIKRTALSTSFKPERVSELVDPEIKAMLEPLSFEALENRVFCVYNKALGQYMLFVPNAEAQADTTETVAFVYSYRPALRVENWSRFRGWNFTCGVTTLAGSVLFADADANVWLLGTEANPYSQDYINGTSGTDIEFEWELPWFDLDQRDKSKNSKHISFDTRGASEFTIEMFVDNFLDTPACSMRFSGGEQGNFGSGSQPAGGGRNTSRKKHYAWPAKFQIAKFRFSGTADAQLAFVSITLRYLLGGINR
jgi:hypothetical protein